MPDPLDCTTYRPPWAVLLEATAIGEVTVPDSASKAIGCAAGGAGVLVAVLVAVLVTVALVVGGGVVPVPPVTSTRAVTALSAAS